MNHKFEQFVEAQNEKSSQLMSLIQQQNEMIRQLTQRPLMQKKGKTTNRQSAAKKKLQAAAAAELEAIDAGAGTSTGLFGTIRSHLPFGGSGHVEPQLNEAHKRPQSPPGDMSSRSSTSSFGRIEDPITISPVQACPVPLPPQEPPVCFNIGGTKKSVWVTKCELQLNGQPVDQLESKQLKDQAMNDFNRLYLTNGLANSLQSNFINYQLFMGGCFISAWDLSTSGFCGNAFALPNIKTGW